MLHFTERMTCRLAFYEGALVHNYCLYVIYVIYMLSICTCDVCDIQNLINWNLFNTKLHPAFYAANVKPGLACGALVHNYCLSIRTCDVCDIQDLLSYLLVIYC